MSSPELPHLWSSSAGPHSPESRNLLRNKVGAWTLDQRKTYKAFFNTLPERASRTKCLFMLIGSILWPIWVSNHDQEETFSGLNLEATSKDRPELEGIQQEFPCSRPLSGPFPLRDDEAESIELVMFPSSTPRPLTQTENNTHVIYRIILCCFKHNMNMCREYNSPFCSQL